MVHWDNWIIVNQFMWYVHQKTNQQMLTKFYENFGKKKQLLKISPQTKGWLMYKSRHAKSVVQKNVKEVQKYKNHPTSFPGTDSGGHLRDTILFILLLLLEGFAVDFIQF